MPSNHSLLRIDIIRQTLADAPLSLTAAEKAEREFSALAQDCGEESFFFFVLKHIFGEIGRLLDGEAVTAERHRDLTEDTRIKVVNLLGRFLAGESASVLMPGLQNAVELHLVRSSLFRTS